MIFPQFWSSYLAATAITLGALVALVWISAGIWAFRDMSGRTRARLSPWLAALGVWLLPISGLIIYLLLRPRETLHEAYQRVLEEEALLQQIEERPSCPGCSRLTQAGWIVCPYCFTRLRRRCPVCQSANELHWTLCPFCGYEEIEQLAALVPAEDVVAENHSTAAAGEPEWPSSGDP
jgi:hypothetical protein